MTTPIPELPQDMREAQGIHQSDIIIRTAIMAGLDDLRANPDLLNYVFASLPKDPLTYRVYGEEQVNLAKEWFINTDIPVMMNTRLDESKVPCITIGLQGSVESEATLGDVHYQTSETLATSNAEIEYGGPFTPLRYDANTGYLVFPTTFDLEVFPGMYVRTSDGTHLLINDVVDNRTIILDPNLNINMNGLYIVSAPTPRTVSLESVEFRETFEIGAHALGEPVYLTYLHSILIFILLRYKEELLEARGLARTQISAGPVVLNTSFETAQPVFSRMTTLTGYVHQYWPKFIRQPMAGITTQVLVDDNPRANSDGLIIPAAYPTIK